MPSKIKIDSAGICKRCGALDALIYTRQDFFCQDCFVRFVNTKVTKRMEGFRVRNTTLDAQRKLLLPVSGGMSSTTLLHILDAQVGAQVSRTGRAGFQLHVLLVDVVAGDKEHSDSFFSALKERYPRHSFHRVDLFDDGEPSDAGSRGSNSQDVAVASNGTSSSLNGMPAVLTSISSSTSSADILNISLTRAITRIATELSCEAVLWGSTTTRLAERILSETAKGRGFALPWLVNDGESPYNGLHFMYPMKDLLRKELPPYADAVDLLRLEGIADSVSATVSTKNVTIDGLMKEYFESVEENYPSIVTNVVRTSSKLSIPTSDTHRGSCDLCGMPVAYEAYGLHGWGGSDTPEIENATPLGSSNGSSNFCYGCARSMLDISKSNVR